MDNGSGIFSHELTASEMNRLSLVLSDTGTTAEQKRIQVVAIVNSIAPIRPVAQNYEQGMDNTMVKAKTCKSDKRQNSEITNTSPIKDNNYDQMQCDNQRHGQPAATVRTNSEGQSFICLTVKATIPAKSGAGKQVEISVSMDGEETDTTSYAVGARVEMQGTLTFRKRSDNLYLNFHAEAVDFAPVSDKDSITGDIEFRGTIGKQVEEKTDKKGGKYLVFSLSAPRKTEKPSLSLGCVSSVSRQSGRLSLHLDGYNSQGQARIVSLP